MALKGLFDSGASVETVLHTDRVRLGAQIHGVVNVRGGHIGVNVNYIDIALITWPTVISHSGRTSTEAVHHRHRIAGAFPLQPNQTFQVPFAMPVPWRTPFTDLTQMGIRFKRTHVGVRSKLGIAQSADKTDVEYLLIEAAPSYEAILMGLERLGFWLQRCRLECTRDALGSPQPPNQALELIPANQFSHLMREFEVRFTTDAQGIDVSLGIKRRAIVNTILQVGFDWNKFRVDHATAVSQDWASVLHQHLNDILSAKSTAVRHMAPVLRPAAPPHPAYPPGYSAPSIPSPPQPPPPADPAAAGIKLTRGDEVDLSRQAPGLTRVTVGVGWGRAVSGGTADLDLSAIVIDGQGRALGQSHFVFHNNLSSPGGVVRHGGDTKDGERHGDDEIIQVDLANCPPQAQRIAFVVSTDTSDSLTLGQVRDVYIRVVNSANAGEIARLDLEADASQHSATVFGELRRTGVDWTFAAVGHGNPEGLTGILRSFGLAGTTCRDSTADKT